MFNYTSTQIISGASDEAYKAIRLYDAAHITKIHKTPYSAATTTKAVFNLGSGFTSGNSYRLEIFIRLNDNAQSDYSNALVFKEKPVYFEFEASATSINAATLATAFNADQTRYGYTILTATASNTNELTITGTTEFQTIVDAKVSEWKSATTLDFYKGDFIPMTGANIPVITKGKVAFGSYDWILRNLRLPTVMNKRFTSPTETEMPVPGVTYNQYIIYYRKDRGILGGAAVGQVTTSETCHVFYVNSTLTTDYCTYLDNLVSTINTSDLTLTLDDYTLADTSGTATATVKFLGATVVPATLTFAAGTVASPLTSTTLLTAGAATGIYPVVATYVSEGVTYTTTVNVTIE